MAVQFGVDRDAGTYGVVRDVSIESTGDMETYSDADGDVAGYHAFNEQQRVTCNWTYDDALPPPAHGDVVTIAGVQVIVTSVEDAEEQNGFRTVKVEGTRWVTNALP